MLSFIERGKRAVEAEKFDTNRDERIRGAFRRINAITKPMQTEYDVLEPSLVIVTNYFAAKYGIVMMNRPVAVIHGSELLVSLGYQKGSRKLIKDPQSAFISLTVDIPEPGGQKNEQYIVSKDGGLLAVQLFHGRFIPTRIPTEDIEGRLQLVEQALNAVEEYLKRNKDEGAPFARQLDHQEDIFT